MRAGTGVRVQDLRWVFDWACRLVALSYVVFYGVAAVVIALSGPRDGRSEFTSLVEFSLPVAPVAVALITWRCKATVTSDEVIVRNVLRSRSFLRSSVLGVTRSGSPFFTSLGSVGLEISGMRRAVRVLAYRLIISVTSRPY